MTALIDAILKLIALLIALTPGPSDTGETQHQTEATTVEDPSIIGTVSQEWIDLNNGQTPTNPPIQTGPTPPITIIQGDHTP